MFVVRFILVGMIETQDTVGHTDIQDSPQPCRLVKTINTHTYTLVQMQIVHMDCRGRVKRRNQETVTILRNDQLINTALVRWI